MKKVVILHYQPIELYPPCLNLIEFFEKEKPNHISAIFTTQNNYGLEATNIHPKIIRPIHILKKDPRIVKLIKMLWYNVKTIYNLFIIKPTDIIIYETPSSFAGLFYSCMTKKPINLYVHYHEYTSPDQYKKAMAVDKIFHHIETKFLYKKAKWVSHTNSFRMNFFLQDIKWGQNTAKFHIMPNYPSEEWVTKKSLINDKIDVGTPLKIVFVGSLSTQNMYTKEFFSWVSSQNGHVVFDFYAFNIKNDVFELLKEMNCPYIHFKGHAPYKNLADILAMYDVGIIMYKDVSLNVTYSAPNKLFEYLACGLDVWCSDNLIASREFERTDCYPKVYMINFNDLSSFDWKKAINKEGLPYQPSEYTYPSIYSLLLNEICKS